MNSLTAKPGASALVLCGVVWFMFHACLKVLHKGIFVCSAKVQMGSNQQL